MTDAKEKFVVRTRNPEEYRQDTENANRGSRRGQRVIERSYRERGAGRSWLVDKDDMLIAGNHAQQAALAAGIAEVVEIEVRDPRVQVVVKRPDLDLDNDGDSRARMMAFEDNRAGEVSLEWSPEQIAEHQSLLREAELFRDDELEALLKQGEIESEVGEQLDQPAHKDRSVLLGTVAQVEVVQSIEDLATFEAAIKLARQLANTRNRGKCLSFICAEFLKAYSSPEIEAALHGQPHSEGQ